LLIYHQGHGGNPYNFEYFLYLKEKFKSKGYDVLSLSMSGLGYNFLGNTNYSFPINAEKNSEVSFNYTFTDKEILNHSIYRSYYDNNYPKIKPLALMLSGNYYLIKNLENNYDEIIMMGISGGGWATTMLAALLPKIKKSYNFHSSGAVPKILKMNKYLIGHWEDTYSKMWEKYDYWDFYFLSLLDSGSFQNREHHLIHNLRHKGFEDDHNVPFVEVLKNLVDLISIKNLNVVVLDKDLHEIDIEFFDNYILKKID
jgi:pimeloyl-ACP methyl ester carboxylesterase